MPRKLENTATNHKALTTVASLAHFLVVALKTQAASTVKIKQIKRSRSDMVTFLFSVHTITEAKQ